MRHDIGIGDLERKLEFWCGSSAVVFQGDAGALEKQGPDEARYRDWRFGTETRILVR